MTLKNAIEALTSEQREVLAGAIRESQQNPRPFDELYKRETAAAEYILTTLTENKDESS